MSCQIFTICTFLASFMSFQLVLSRLWPSRLCFSSIRLSSLFPFVSDLQIQLQLFCKLSPFLDCVLFSGLREARFHFYFIQFLLMFFQIESHSRLCFVFWATCFYSTFSFLSQVFLFFFSRQFLPRLCSLTYIFLYYVFILKMGGQYKRRKITKFSLEAGGFQRLRQRLRHREERKK